MLTDAVVLVPPEPPAVVQRRDLLLAGGNPWYTALLYGIGDETKVREPALLRPALRRPEPASARTCSAQG